MKKHDIVYVLRNDIEPYELTYSLRTLRNFPHNRVIFFGGQPSYLEPDIMVSLKQVGLTKWDKVSYTLRSICQYGLITDDFWLFNDDFFVLKKQTDFKNAYNGDLISRVREVEARYGNRQSAYSKQLRSLIKLLDKEGMSTLNYAVHMPMLINKEKALEVLEKYPSCPMFRSLYGNYHQIGGENRKDVKILGMDRVPSEDADFVSTSDESFINGAVGRFIRERFTERSEFEV